MSKELMDEQLDVRQSDFPGGYNGKILRVNLSTGSFSVENLDPLFCRKYIGGAGFIAYYLWKELENGVDPLGPGNKLIFALGPVTGLPVAGAARHCVGAKSPLTGGIAKAEVGGHWGAELRRTGYDAVIIEGKADQPVYLWITEDQVSIRSAARLWGQETKETEAALRAELGDDRVQVAMIGPGGENLVRYASIMHGCRHAGGRGGLGAVMGSKNLKAVAVRGKQRPQVADRDKLREIARSLVARPHPFSEYGTGGPEIIAFEKSGNLPVRNFRDGLFPGAKNITGVIIKETIRIGMEGCYACPIRCKKVVEFAEPYKVDRHYGGPEYETIAAFGSNCGIDDLRAICKANERCNAYSLDTISAGSVIAFAMECFERGLLTTKDTGGLELKFGSSEALLQLIELICRREGIGALLAQGTLRMAQELGRGPIGFAMQVKGLDCGYHEPRLRPNLGLGYMVNPTGADHCLAVQDQMMNNPAGIEQVFSFGVFEPVPPNVMDARQVRMFMMGQFKSVLEDSLVLCHFPPFTYDIVIDLLRASTGWNIGSTEILRAAQRILTVMRLFNLNQGLSEEHDVLPERFYQPKTDGPLSDKPLSRETMEKAKRGYYILMGWSENGVPLPETLEDLYIG